MNCKTCGFKHSEIRTCEEACTLRRILNEL